MTRLFEALSREAQERLLRDGVVDLVKIVSWAVPDPHRPDNRTGMVIETGSRTEFAGGLLCTRAVHTMLRRVCRHTEKDLSKWSCGELLVALNRRRKEVDRMKPGKIGDQTLDCPADPGYNLPSPTHDTEPGVPVWELAWTAAMGDDGKMFIDCEEHFYSMAIDDVSRENIRGRMRRVNNVVGKEVLRLLGGG